MASAGEYTSAESRTAEPIIRRRTAHWVEPDIRLRSRMSCTLGTRTEFKEWIVSQTNQNNGYDELRDSVTQLDPKEYMTSLLETCKSVSLSDNIVVVMSSQVIAAKQMCGSIFSNLQMSVGRSCACSNLVF